ncbi:MAG TPA: hypothetical protein VN673_03405 [Clostridia bacterium]|nr:hypothetical protein [Clostridia bacterium]
MNLLPPAELQAMLDDLSLSPDLRASIERLLAVTLQLTAERIHEQMEVRNCLNQTLEQLSDSDSSPKPITTGITATKAQLEQSRIGAQLVKSTSSPEPQTRIGADENPAANIAATTCRICMFGKPFAQ